MEKQTKPGTLTLVPTPIGNLEDMTFRAIRTLKEADLIAAEDTRTSRILLDHYGITTPLTSYHEHNKLEKAPSLIGKMQRGQQLALITDAGTPGISDPGEELVALCYEEGIEIFALPGAAAFVTAAVSSGLPARRLAFEAFLPKKKKERRRVLEELKNETRTILLYEAPHHLTSTLKELYEVLGDRRITLCRELSKRYEEKIKTTLANAVLLYEETPPRGEFVLVIEGKSKEDVEKEKKDLWKDVPPEERYRELLKSGLDKNAAMRQIAEERGMKKREVYALLKK